jgi:flagellar biogenesis protein FliO
MFESEQPATKSKIATTSAVVFIVLAILLGLTWFFTRA